MSFPDHSQPHSQTIPDRSNPASFPDHFQPHFPTIPTCSELGLPYYVIAVPITRETILRLVSEAKSHEKNTTRITELQQVML